MSVKKVSKYAEMSLVELKLEYVRIRAMGSPDWGGAEERHERGFGDVMDELRRRGVHPLDIEKEIKEGADWTNREGGGP